MIMSRVCVQVVPKPGFYKKFAIFAVRFGSVDSEFVALWIIMSQRCPMELRISGTQTV